MPCANVPFLHLKRFSLNLYTLKAMQEKEVRNMKFKFTLNLTFAVSVFGLLVALYYLPALGIFGAAPFLLLFGTIAAASQVHTKTSIKHHHKRKIKFAPVSGSFMAVSIMGILVSLMYVYPESHDWGVTLAVVFGIMFAASVVSMTVSDPATFIELERKK
jgi:amino acid transporter